MSTKAVTSARKCESDANLENTLMSGQHLRLLCRHFRVPPVAQLQEQLVSNLHWKQTYERPLLASSNPGPVNRIPAVTPCNQAVILASRHTAPVPPGPHHQLVHCADVPRSLLNLLSHRHVDLLSHLHVGLLSQLHVDLLSQSPVG